MKPEVQRQLVNFITKISRNEIAKHFYVCLVKRTYNENGVDYIEGINLTNDVLVSNILPAGQYSRTKHKGVFVLPDISSFIFVVDLGQPYMIAGVPILNKNPLIRDLKDRMNIVSDKDINMMTTEGNIRIMNAEGYGIEITKNGDVSIRSKNNLHVMDTDTFNGSSTTHYYTPVWSNTPMNTS